MLTVPRAVVLVFCVRLQLRTSSPLHGRQCPDPPFDQVRRRGTVQVFTKVSTLLIGKI